MPDKRISFRKSSPAKSLELQFGIRLLAFLFDLMLINLILFPGIVWLTEDSMGWQTESLFSFTGSNIMTFLIYWIYFAAFEGAVGATPGKLFVRLPALNCQPQKQF